jgi:hypothetical protein
MTDIPRMVRIQVEACLMEARRSIMDTGAWSDARHRDAVTSVVTAIDLTMKDLAGGDQRGNEGRAAVLVLELACTLVRDIRHSQLRTAERALAESVRHLQSHAALAQSS